MVSLVILTLTGAASAAASPIVHVPGLGSLDGAYLLRNASTTSWTNISAFLGIPYGKAPIGDLRWRPPQPYGAWPSPRDAKAFGNVCWQPEVDFAELPGRRDEDCLFLNIFAPTAALSSARALRLPTMVWIHGGAYTNGASNPFDGSGMLLASNLSVVVVTLNYRLNVFGFLGSRNLRGRSEDSSIGNYGMQDQRLALEWVRANIGAFGGDANAVTIFGQSAGGDSVVNHLTQPASFSLYHRAIVQSGAYEGVVAAKDAEIAYASILKKTSCANVNCLLDVPASQLVDLQSSHLNSKWGPVVDGISLADSPQSLIEQGRYNKRVPIMIGSTRDESSFFLLMKEGAEVLPASLSDLELDAFLALTVDLGHVQEVKALYAPSRYSYPKDLGNFTQAWWVAMRVSTDAVPGLGPCGVRSMARNLVASGSPGVLVYLFEHPTQVHLPSVPGTTPGSAVVPHASEVSYVFYDMTRLHGSEASLAREMAEEWTAFAAASSTGRAWPHYAADEDIVLSFRTAEEGGIRTESHVRRDACDFWDRVKQRGPFASTPSSSTTTANAPALLI